MTKISKQPVVDLKFEAALEELEAIVQSLEEGEHPLEESIALYERGQLLQKHCSTLLEQAELRVQQLSGEILTKFEGGA